MRLIDVLYNKYYPLTLLNKYRARKRNSQKKLTILCGNCMGGYMYHQLNLPFQSPTINITMAQPDLFCFVKNIDVYRGASFEKEQGLMARLGDVRVHFTHYDSFEAGVDAWKKRFGRVVTDNIFIMATDRDGITHEQIYEYGDVPCKKLVIFTAKKYDLPYCFHVNEFDGCECVGNLLAKTMWGKWKFETFFDWVGWLNSTDVVAENFRIR